MDLSAFNLRRYQEMSKSYGVPTRSLRSGKWVQVKSSRPGKEWVFVRTSQSPTSGYIATKRIVIRDERYTSSGEERGAFHISTGNERSGWDTGLSFPTYPAALKFAKSIMKSNVIRW